MALKGGKLVITLKKAAGSVTVRPQRAGPDREQARFRPSVKKHKIKSLTVALKVTDAKQTAPRCLSS